MKTLVLLVLIALLSGASSYGQDQFIYDQESANEQTPGGSPASLLPSEQPVGQSFVPRLSSVGFIRLSTRDTQMDGFGATLYVMLRTDSITGPVIASTAPVILLDGFNGHVNFTFATPARVTPGTTYYFQPVLESGVNWVVHGYNDYNYPDGDAYYRGLRQPGLDLWFREGVVVPEPATLILSLTGLLTLMNTKPFRTACAS